MDNTGIQNEEPNQQQPDILSTGTQDGERNQQHEETMIGLRSHLTMIRIIQNEDDLDSPQHLLQYIEALRQALEVVDNLLNVGGFSEVDISGEELRVHIQEVLDINIGILQELRSNDEDLGFRIQDSGLSEEVQKIPTIQITKQHVEDTSCTICCTDYEEGVHVSKLPCSHLFHTECIVNWLIENTTCPNCRAYVRC